MSLIKLAIASAIVQDPRDPRMLAATERRKPQPRVKPNKTILNWGMKK